METIPANNQIPNIQNPITYPPPVQTTPSPLPPASTPSNPQLKTRRILVIILILVSTFGLILYILISPRLNILKSTVPQQLTTQSENQQKISSQAILLANSYNSGDFSPLISFLEKKPRAEWIASTSAIAQTSFVDQVNFQSDFSNPNTATSSAYVANPGVDLCKIVSSQNCKALDNTKYQIFLSNKIVHEQPFAVAALVSNQLRKVYNLKNFSLSCPDRIADELTWAASFWKSFNPEERSPIPGFGTGLVDSQNGLLSRYQENQLGIIIKNASDTSCMAKQLLLATPSATPKK